MLAGITVNLNLYKQNPDGGSRYSPAYIQNMTPKDFPDTIYYRQFEMLDGMVYKMGDYFLKKRIISIYTNSKNSNKLFIKLKNVKGSPEIFSFNKEQDICSLKRL